jgi:hypothetical protein
MRQFPAPHPEHFLFADPSGNCSDIVAPDFREFGGDVFASIICRDAPDRVAGIIGDQLTGFGICCWIGGRGGVLLSAMKLVTTLALSRWGSAPANGTWTILCS